MEQPHILPLDSRYEGFLCDESRLQGWADSISFPESAGALRQTLDLLRAQKLPFTVQGGRTGIAGGAIPQGGHILNLSRMNHVLDFRMEADGTAVLTAEAGLTVLELRQAVAARTGAKPLFWPPEPTASTASIGGIAATGAAGIFAGHYGGTAAFFTAAEIIRPDGRPETLHGSALRREIGAEGTGGVFSILTLRLIPVPPECWALCFFFRDVAEAARLAEALRHDEGLRPVLAAAEFLSGSLLELAEQYRSTMPRLQALPPWPADSRAALYLELHGGETDILAAADRLLELGSDCGDERIWAVSGPAEVERLRELRVIAAELVNRRLDETRLGVPTLRKLATDMTFPLDDFSTALRRYLDGAASHSLPCCIYGPILSGGLTVCLLPECEADYDTAVGLIRSWAQEALRQGGQTVGKYGVGKLNPVLLQGLLGTAGEAAP